MICKKEYRGRELAFDMGKIRMFEVLSGFSFDTSCIDQYLLNETDKKNIDPFNTDYDNIASQYSTEQIEKIVNGYLDFEIRLRG